jgi:hypothetical protein
MLRPFLVEEGQNVEMLRPFWVEPGKKEAQHFNIVEGPFLRKKSGNHFPLRKRGHGVRPQCGEAKMTVTTALGKPK